MYLVQLLLPLYDNDQHPIAQALFARVREELVERFGGLTSYARAPARGIWKDDGNQSHRDDIVTYEVMAETLDRDWWSTYRKELEKRFAQSELIIRAQDIQVL